MEDYTVKITYLVTVRMPKDACWDDITAKALDDEGLSDEYAEAEVM